MASLLTRPTRPVRGTRTASPFPSSGGVLEAFLERIRFSPSQRIDTPWLVECLGISQKTNAGRTLDWLRAAGIVDVLGSLTDRGKNLLQLPDSNEFKKAALDALYAVCGESRVPDLRSGQLTRERLRQQICEEYRVKPNTANKAIVGMYVLALAAGELAVARALGSTDYQVHTPTYQPIALETAKVQILTRFGLLFHGHEDIEGWLSDETPSVTFERLSQVPIRPMTVEQLNQLLTLGHAPPMSSGFFTYYWLSRPEHPYDLEDLPGYSDMWAGSTAIFHVDQLYWGLYRLYVDALLFFGSVRSAYQLLRDLSLQEITSFFKKHMLSPRQLISRGPALPLVEISKDDRYLISEMACKSYAPNSEEGIDLITALQEA